jgi:hypothetical protein
MARKKKTTKRYVTVNKQDSVTVDKSAPDPTPKQAKDVRMTIDEAVKWFKADPHMEEFISLDKMGTAIAHGNRYIQFVKGVFLTSDPVEVEILLRANDPGAKYGTHFVALNPVLRNLKK